MTEPVAGRGSEEREEGAEREALKRTLAAQREHVLDILEGLSESDLRRPVLPSGWTCLGLVQHLALDVERFWFRQVVSGDVDAGKNGAEVSDVGDAWQVDSGRAAAEILDLYRREAEQADVVIDATAIDAAPRWWPEERFGSWRLENLREILLHVVGETACHAGHLDAVRELIDGRLWLVLTS